MSVVIFIKITVKLPLLVKTSTLYGLHYGIICVPNRAFARFAGTIRQSHTYFYKRVRYVRYHAVFEMEARRSSVANQLPEC